MLIPEDVIEKVRESNDIIDVISEFVPLKRRGKNYVGLCPFHKEKTPSFSVQQDKQIYHCFGCGEGGNVISFLMKYRNIGFVEAVRVLAERANIVIPESGSSESSEKISLREKIFEINREAARFFYINLHRNAAAIDYFRNRGINAEIVKRFGLGYALNSPNSLMNYLIGKKYSLDLLEKAGLVIKRDDSNYHDRFRNRVMFPVLDVRSRIIGFGGRVLDNSKPKYLNSPETPVFNKGNNLYGLNIAAKSNIDRKIIIVEGYMDVIALHQYGIENAVASLGTALTREQAKLIKRYSERVIISYDADTAGQAATLRGLDILAQAGLEVGILKIPKGKDPDEFVRSDGRDAFLQCAENAMPLTEYVIRRKSEGFDISSTEGKIGFIKACAHVLGGIDDPVTVDAYVVKLSGETGISSSALYDEISKVRKNSGKDPEDHEGDISGKNRYNNNIAGQKLYIEPAYIKAEKFILSILYVNNNLFKTIEKMLSWQDFNDAVYSKVAHIVFDCLKNNTAIEPASIVSLFSDVDDMKKVSDIFSSTTITDMDNIDKMISDYVNLIKKSRLIAKKDEISLKIKEYEGKGDVQQSLELLKELMEIEKKLRYSSF